MDMDALEDMEIEDIEKLLQSIKMGIAFTELEVIGNKPKPDVVVEEKIDKDLSSIKKEDKEVKKGVKTGDDSPIMLYLGLTVMMGLALITLRRKESA